jgi:hypothetical protein
MQFEDLISLRVIVIPDENAFFAQGLDIDYCASGQTVADTIEAFELGLEILLKRTLEKEQLTDKIPRPSIILSSELYRFVFNDQVIRRKPKGLICELYPSITYYLEQSLCMYLRH